MKYINNVMELLGVATFALLLYGLVQYFISSTLYQYILYGVGVVVCVLIYILSTKYERDLEELCDSYQSSYLHWFNKYGVLITEYNKLEKELNVEMEWNKKFQDDIKGYKKVERELMEEVDKLEKELSDCVLKEPFSEQDTIQDNEQVYTCLQCGSGNVRVTPKMIICNECSKRRMK